MTMYVCVKWEGDASMLSDDYSWYLTLARVQHLTEAAEMLDIPQPTLSRKLSGLERRIGTTLFDRGGRSLRLNERGRALEKAVQGAVRSLDRGEEEIRRLLDPETGRIRFGFMPSLGPWLAPRLIRAFTSEHPRAEMVLSQDTAEVLVGRLLDGELDVALCAPDVLPGLLGDLNILTVHRQAMALVVPEGHRLAGRELVDFKEVAREPFVAAPAGYTTRNILERLAKKSGVVPRIVMESEALATHAGLASTGIGITVLPDDDPSLHVPGAVFVPLKTELKRDIALVWPSSVEQVPVVRSFLEDTSNRYGDSKQAER